MRICLYVGKAAPEDKREEWLANALSTCDVYAANLYREFTARGIEVVFASSLSARPTNITEEMSAKRLARYEKMEFPEADHAICLEQNGWKYRDEIFFEKARAATKGLVCSICDHDHVVDGPQDLIFTARRPVNPDRARYVGWAANPEMFAPEKDPDWLTIFIDHKYHAAEKVDHTEALLKSATEYAAKLNAEGRKVGKPPRRVQVVFFSPNGIERIEPSEVRDVDLGKDRRSFYARVPGPLLAEWTRKTDIFVVTHSESMGLPVLENAMAGALVVAKRGFVKPELLRSLAHYEYDEVEQIDWDMLVDQLNPSRFQRRASHFTWKHVAQRMLEALTGRDRQPRPEPVRQGSMLVAPPPRFGAERDSLTTWRTLGLDVQPAGRFERIIPTGGKSGHFARRDLRKKPWPETFTFSFAIRPNGRDNVALWLCGEAEEERATVRFDLQSQSATVRRETNGWSVIDSWIVEVGGELLCQMVAKSDYAPVLRCYIFTERDGEIDFEAEAEEPGLEIGNVRIYEGIAFVADIGLQGTDEKEVPAAANG